MTLRPRRTLLATHLPCHAPPVPCPLQYITKLREEAFKPTPAKLYPVPHLVQQALQAVDPDVRREMCQNVIVTGGNSLFPGLAERLQAEINLLLSGVRWRLALLCRHCGAWP